MTVQERYQLIAALSAIPGGAPKTTARLLANTSCFDDTLVLKSAVAEVGLPVVAAYVLKSQPLWALQMLRVFPDLGAFKDPLVAKAALMNETALQVTPVVAAAAGFGPPVSIGSLAMYLQGNASFTACFTMFWYTPPFRGPAFWEPMMGTPDSSKWYQSEKLSDYGKQTLSCANFATATSPLHTGDIVVLIAQISGNGNGNINTGFYFSYDAGSAVVATINTWGGVDSPGFSQSTATPSS